MTVRLAASEGTAARAPAVGAGATHRVLLPGATLGVLGGGQLGRMFVHAAQRMGYGTVVLDPDPVSPAGHVAHKHVLAGYHDATGLEEMLATCDAITTEFENVPASSLAALAARVPVAPPARAVSIAQDRALEKTHFAKCGVPCAPHFVIDSAEQLAAVPSELFPGILKTLQMGYDGKGQQRVASASELAGSWDAMNRAPCVLEKMLPLAYECSVVVARGHDGAIVNLPVQRNLHRDGILAVTEVFDGCVPPEQGTRVVEAARAIAEGLQYVGVLCVEFFVLEDGSLVVNEMAPRPHNSGHWSIEGSDVSQFELQVRTLAGLPLVPPRQYGPAIMLNLLGDLWFDGGAEREPAWPQVLALPGASLHLYGKDAARHGRKMGHLTLTGAAVADVRDVATKAARILGIAPF